MILVASKQNFDQSLRKRGLPIVGWFPFSTRVWWGSFTSSLPHGSSRMDANRGPGDSEAHSVSRFEDSGAQAVSSKDEPKIMRLEVALTALGQEQPVRVWKKLSRRPGRRF